MRMLRARSSRLLVVVVLLALCAGTFAALRNSGAPGRKATPTPLFSVTETPIKPVAAGAPATRPAGGTTADAPATRPATAATRPTTLPGGASLTHAAPATGPAIVIRPSLSPIADAQARIDAGALVEARRILNDAVVTGRLDGPQLTTARELVSRINQSLVFGRKIAPGDPFVTAYTVRPGEVLEKIAARESIPWELLCRINGISDPHKLKAGQTLKMLKGPVHAVVHKRTFQMDLYLGQPGGVDSMLITTLPVGLGADGSTPVGTWKVINKLKNPTYHSPRAEGIIAADDPGNPLGEYWLGLEGLDGQAIGKSSYGIHGTIEPDSIGKEASMGCIRLRTDDIALVYELLVPDKSRLTILE
jgi:LysM repeat protein